LAWWCEASYGVARERVMVIDSREICPVMKYGQGKHWGTAGE